MEQEKENLKIIATRVPPALAQDIEKAAERELLSVAAFVRRLLFVATRSEPRVAA